MSIAVLLASALLGVQPPAAHPARRAYGFVSSTLSIHPGNGEEYHRVYDRLHGRAWTIGGGAGVFLTPDVGVETEFVFAGNVWAPQGFHYMWSEEYVANNRDILVNELVRYRPGGRSAVQFVGGGGYAHTTTQETSILYIDVFGRRTPQPDSVKTSYSRLTFTGGFDALFHAGARAEVGPTFRVRWLHRPAGGERGWNGIGNYAFQIGASVFFR